MRFRDFSLLFATLLSAVVGVFSPWAETYLSFVPLYGMMGLLYISFTPLRFDSIVRTIQVNHWGILWFVIARMFVFPSVIYCILRFIAPDYALAGLLLTGAATAVVAPFMAYLLEVDVAFTTVLTVASSFLLPFTLPFVVMFWVGASIDISPSLMVLTLAQMILLPGTAALLTQKFLPAFIAPIQKQTYFWGLTITCCSTLVIFSRYSDFFFETPGVILEGGLMALLIAVMIGVLSYLSSVRLSSGERISFMLCSLLLNLVLVVVLCNEFFGPREAITAVMYTIPFYATILPLRAGVVANLKKTKAAQANPSSTLPEGDS